MKYFKAEKGCYVTHILYYLRLGARKVIVLCIKYLRMNETVYDISGDAVSRSDRMVL
jgi:hypothetical protein